MIHMGFTLSVDCSAVWFVVTDGERFAYFETFGGRRRTACGRDEVSIRVGDETWTVLYGRVLEVRRTSGHLVSDQVELLERFGRQLDGGGAT
ncbi:MAG: hypothetical protein WC058_05350 [Phycisphaeraceae bacterium]